jgi:hypothetical protein
MSHHRSPLVLRAILSLLLGISAIGQTFAAGDAGFSGRADSRLIEVAQEARQTIAVIDWFYVRHRACPQPSRPAELLVLQSELGDGFTLDRQGQFVAIRGISMSSVWLYYTSPAHPDKCTLWRKLGWDPALIWRRQRGGGRWSFDPGDGGAERAVNVAR